MTEWESLAALLRDIGPADGEARRRTAGNWNGLAKPLGSLGALETMVADMSALTGNPRVTAARPVLFVCCADNGVVREGVSQSDHTVTCAVANALGDGTSTVNHMAAGTGCRVVPVDLGILDYAGHKGVLSRRIRNGTGDIAREPAMTEAETLAAIRTGIELVRDAKKDGHDLILCGEMGIGNTTTAAALAAALLGRTAAEMTGRGAGLSDVGLARKIQVIETALRRHDEVEAADDRAMEGHLEAKTAGGKTIACHGDVKAVGGESVHCSSEEKNPAGEEAFRLLADLGGLDIAAMCGIFLGGALWRVPVLMDGVISMTAALAAVRMAPAARMAVFPSHLSSEPAARCLAEALEMKPLLQAGMHLGEGGGAVAFLPLLQMALRVYDSGHTFERLGIEAYQPL